MQTSQNPIENNFISDVSKGPLRTVKSYPVYFINGFKYHTQSHGNNRQLQTVEFALRVN